MSVREIVICDMCEYVNNWQGGEVLPSKHFAGTAGDAIKAGWGEDGAVHYCPEHNNETDRSWYLAEREQQREGHERYLREKALREEQAKRDRDERRKQRDAR